MPFELANSVDEEVSGCLGSVVASVVDGKLDAAGAIDPVVPVSVSAVSILLNKQRSHNRRKH